MERFVVNKFVIFTFFTCFSFQVFAIATGGEISLVGGDQVHIFKSSGTFTVPTNNTLTNVRLLIVGGGGAGGNNSLYAAGGGGGAGGFRELSGLHFTAGEYKITVGEGGKIQAGYGQGRNGSDSVIKGGCIHFASKGGGGGGGGGGVWYDGLDGGSGGGGGAQIQIGMGGNGHSSQGGQGGSPLGNGADRNLRAGGGGGGADQHGGDASISDKTYGGNGGNGKSSDITGTSIYYSGGGGGALANNGQPGAGGLGGGGTGGGGSTELGYGNNGINGAENTGGGGGGGGGADRSNKLAGNGGSGIVILRYSVTPSKVDFAGDPRVVNPQNAVVGKVITELPAIPSGVAHIYGDVSDIVCNYPVPFMLEQGTGSITNSAGEVSTKVSEVITELSDENGIATLSTWTYGETPGTYKVRMGKPITGQGYSFVANLVADKSSQLTLTTQPGVTASEALLSPQPVVKITDQFANLDANATANVSVSLEGEEGELLSATDSFTVATVGGVATFSGLSISGKTDTVYRLKFTPEQGSEFKSAFSTDLILTNGGSPSKLDVNVAPVAASSESTFTTPAVIGVYDAKGNAVNNATNKISVRLIEENGEIGGETQVDAINGEANFDSLTLSGLVGANYTLVFSADGLQPVQVENVVLLDGGAPAKLAFNQLPATSTSDKIFDTPAELSILDKYDNPVTRATNEITASMTKGSANLSGTLTQAASSGIARFENLVLSGKINESNTLTFSAENLAPISTELVLENPSSANKLALQSQPVLGVNDAVFANKAVVMIQDGNGNPVLVDDLLVSASITEGDNGRLAGNFAVNSVAGVADFSDLIFIGDITQTYRITFEATDLQSITTQPLMLAGAGKPVSLAVATEPIAGKNAQLFDQAPVIEIQDISGNRVSDANDEIAVDMAVGFNGILGGTKKINANQGVAIFSDLTLIGTVGENYALSFSHASLPTVNSTLITLSGAGDAHSLALTRIPVLGHNEASLSVHPRIQIQDINGNLVTDAINTVSVIVNQSSANAGEIIGNTTLSAVEGIVDFSKLIFKGKLSETYQLDFTSDGLISTSTEANLTLTGAGLPASLVLTNEPRLGVNGAKLEPQPLLELRDAKGNITKQINDVVNVDVSSNDAVLAGSQAKLMMGEASFTDLALTGSTAKNYVLTFRTIEGISTTLESLSFTGAAKPSQLIISTAPVLGNSEQEFVQDPIVQVQDANGNLVTNAEHAISLSIFNDTDAVLSNANPVTTLNGEAKFENLILTGKTDKKYRLRFDLKELNLFALTEELQLAGAGAAKKLTLSTEPILSANTQAFTTQPVIAIYDSQDNLVTKADNKVQVSISSGEGGSIGGTTLLSAVQGAAVYADLTFTGITNVLYDLTFSSEGLASVVAEKLKTTGAGPATQLSIFTPPQLGSNGEKMRSQPEVHFLDISNNLAEHVNDNVSISISAGAEGSIGGVTSQSANKGKVQFSDLTFSGKVNENYQVEFKAQTLILPTQKVSDLFIAAAGEPVSIRLKNQPVAGASEARFSTAPILEVLDANQNPILSGINLNVSVNQGGMLGGNTTVPIIDGEARFTDLTLSGNQAIAYTLSFFVENNLEIPSINATNIRLSGAGSATKLSLVTLPVLGQSGMALTTKPELYIYDANDNLALDADDEITVSISSGLNGELLGSLSSKANQGKVVFSDLGFSGDVNQSYELSFNSTNFATIKVDNLQLSGAGLPAKLAFQTKPLLGNNLALLASQPVVEVRDAKNNFVTQLSTDVTVSVLSGSDGSILNSPNASLIEGVARFTNLSFAGKINTFYVLRFEVANLVLDSSPLSLMSAGAPHHMYLKQKAVLGRSGQQLQTPAVIEIRDASDNLIETATNPVSIDVVNPMLTLTGETQKNAKQGLVSFDDVIATGMTGRFYDLIYRSANLPDLIQPNVEFSGAGDAAQLILKTPPILGKSGQRFLQAPVIEIRDANNNLVLEDKQIRVRISSGENGSLTGTQNLTFNNGIARFDDLALAGDVKQNYELTFETDDSLSVSTLPLKLAGAGDEATLFLVVEPKLAGNGEKFLLQPVLEVRDKQNNPVIDSRLAVTAVIGNRVAGKLEGTTTVNAQNGIVTFTDLSITGGVEQRYNLLFKANGVETLVVSELQLQGAGNAAKLVMQREPKLAANGDLLSAQPVIEIRDAGGNLVTSPNVLVSVSISSGENGKLEGQTQVGSQAGIATFTDLRFIGLVEQGYVLTFSSPQLSSISSQRLSLSHSAKINKIDILSGDKQSMLAGGKLNEPLKVKAIDVLGFPAVNENLNVAVIKGNGSVANTSLSTDINGEATLGIWTLGSSVGSQILRVSSVKDKNIVVDFTATALAGNSLAPYFPQSPNELGTGFDSLSFSEHPLSAGVISASFTLKDEQGIPLASNQAVRSVRVEILSGPSVLRGQTFAKNVIDVPGKTFGKAIEVLSQDNQASYYFDIYPDEIGTTLIQATVTLIDGRQEVVREKLSIIFTDPVETAGKLKILIQPEIGPEGDFTVQPQIGLFDNNGQPDFDVNVGEIRAYVLNVKANLNNRDGTAPTALIAGGLGVFNQLELTADERDEIILGFSAEGYIPVTTEKIQLLPAADLFRDRVEDILLAELRENLEDQRERIVDLSNHGAGKLLSGIKEVNCDQSLQLNLIDRASPSEQQGEAGTFDGEFSKNLSGCDASHQTEIEGEYSVNTGTNMKIISYEADLTLKREERVNQKHFQGLMLGLYSRRSDVETTQATGKVVGNGLYAGFYGANLLSEHEAINYYLSTSMGNHSYKLNFDDENTGFVTTRGDYQYLALLTGGALSKRLNFIKLVEVTPRIGTDLTYAATSEVDLYAEYFSVNTNFDFDLADYFNGEIYIEVDFVKEFILKGYGVQGFKFTPGFWCEKAEIFKTQVEKNSFCGQDYELNYYYQVNDWSLKADYSASREYESRRDNISIKLQKQIDLGSFSIGSQMRDNKDPGILFEVNLNP